MAEVIGRLLFVQSKEGETSKSEMFRINFVVVVSLLFGGRWRIGEHRIEKFPFVIRSVVRRGVAEILVRWKRGDVHIRAVRHDRFDHGRITIDDFFVLLASSARRFGDSTSVGERSAAENFLSLTPSNDENEQKNDDQQRENSAQRTEKNFPSFFRQRPRTFALRNDSSRARLARIARTVDRGFFTGRVQLAIGEQTHRFGTVRKKTLSEQFFRFASGDRKPTGRTVEVKIFQL